MLPRSEVLAWRQVAPWSDEADVEQDLILTRALFDIFGDPWLADRLAFRGGTALHRLYLAPVARYSEDIDLVQRNPEPIGPTLDRLRARLGWIGKIRSDIGTPARTPPASSDIRVERCGTVYPCVASRSA